MISLSVSRMVNGVHLKTTMALSRPLYVCHRQLHAQYTSRPQPLNGRINCKSLQANQRHHRDFLNPTLCHNSTPNHRNFSSDSLSYYVSSDFPPIHHIQECLNVIHVSTGLPWWATIALSTLTLRTALFPISVYSMYIAGKVQVLQDKFKRMATELKAEVTSAAKHYGWSQKVAAAQYRSNMRRLVRQEYIRENCHPLKASLVLWFQVPLWLSCSFALRNMSGTPLAFSGKAQSVMFPDLTSGGLLWFANLTVPDATLVLPVMLAATNLLITEISAVRTENPGFLEKSLTNMLRVVSIAMIPIGAIMPSCMVYYWLCSSTCGLAQNLLLKSPRVLQALQLPRSSQSQSATPYADLYQRLRQKFSLNRLRKQKQVEK